VTSQIRGRMWGHPNPGSCASSFPELLSTAPLQDISNIGLKTLILYLARPCRPRRRDMLPDFVSLEAPADEGQGHDGKPSHVRSVLSRANLIVLNISLSFQLRYSLLAPRALSLVCCQRACLGIWDTDGIAKRNSAKERYQVQRKDKVKAAIP
jgi:hypothetical protein